MSRTIKILIGVVIVVIIVIVGTVVVSGNRPAPAGGRGGPLGTFFSLFTGGSSSSENQATSTPTAIIQTENGESVTIPRLREVYDKPTAGATFLTRNIATTTLVNGVLKNVTLPATFIRYVDRATAHVFETKPDSLSVAEISNTTLPKIYEASFLNNGNSIVLRYLDTAEVNVETYFANLITPTASSSATSSLSVSALPAGTPTPYQLAGFTLPENISAIAISPTKDRVFYLLNDSNGAKGFIVNSTNKPKQIFSNPLREWLLDWPTNNIVMTTKPSGGVAGFVFFLNSTSGGLTKVFDNVAGLTTLSSPDLSSILFSSNNGVDFDLNLYQTKAGSNSTLSLKTLPEKCVWSQKNAGIVYCAVPLVVPVGSYPDIWYQGAVSFSDNIWKINTKTGDRTLIAKPNELAKVNIDAINLSLDPNENYLMFTNKKDLALWNLLINPPTPPAPITATTTPATTSTSSNSVRSTILR